MKSYSQPMLASLLAHLESHINHLFESSENQREHTSDSWRISSDIMTEAESGSVILLNNQQPDL